MNSNRARTCAIRARMSETGEPYNVAARHVDTEHETKTLKDKEDNR